MVAQNNGGRRCPLCGDVIFGNAECARCAENGRLSPEPAQPQGHDARWINEMLACFQFSDEEVAEFSPQVISEIERQLLGSFKTWTLRALLPLLQQRAERFYRFKGLSPEDAKDLSGGFVEKVLDQLSKNFPHGNVGTWIVMIRWSIFVDYLRRKSREREHFGAQQEPEWFAKVPDPLDDEGALELRAFMEELPVEQRDVLDRLREGQKWSEIAEYYQTKTAELRKDLQSLKWPEGSVPLRKNRRRRDPNA